MGRSEREPLDPPLDAAIDYLHTGQTPSDPTFGKIIDGLFILTPRQDTQKPVPHIGPVKRLLRVAGLT